MQNASNISDTNFQVTFVLTKTLLAYGSNFVNNANSVPTFSLICYYFNTLHLLKLIYFVNSSNYYIVESEILKNTQRDIFHIFTSEDIDHVTFSNLLLSVKFRNFLLGTI